MCLQFNGFLVKDRDVAVPVVFHDHVVGHQLAVQVNGYLVADHFDAERIPVVDGIIGHHEGCTAVYFVVVQSTGTYLSTYFNPCGVPGLYLRASAKVDPSVTLGSHSPVDEHFEITVHFFRTEVVTFAFKDQDTTFGLP